MGFSSQRGMYGLCISYRDMYGLGFRVYFLKGDVGVLYSIMICRGLALLLKGGA